VRAFYTQAGASSIYDDVVYEGQSIEMERLSLWVAGNLAGVSPSHRETVMRLHHLSAEELAAVADSARARYSAVDAADIRSRPSLSQSDGCACL
jgi:hypothetical protein